MNGRKHYHSTNIFCAKQIIHVRPERYSRKSPRRRPGLSWRPEESSRCGLPWVYISHVWREDSHPSDSIQCSQGVSAEKTSKKLATYFHAISFISWRTLPVNYQIQSSDSISSCNNKLQYLPLHLFCHEILHPLRMFSSLDRIPHISSSSVLKRRIEYNVCTEKEEIAKALPPPMKSLR